MSRKTVTRYFCDICNTEYNSANDLYSVDTTVACWYDDTEFKPLVRRRFEHKKLEVCTACLKKIVVLESMSPDNIQFIDYLEN